MWKFKKIFNARFFEMKTLCFESKLFWIFDLFGRERKGKGGGWRKGMDGWMEGGELRGERWKKNFEW